MQKKIKCVILAGGVGSRLFEETKIKPKPLVEINSEPIILHIIKYIKKFGINEFFICLGYKGNLIQQKNPFHKYPIVPITFSYALIFHCDGTSL